jgi:transposase
MKTPDPKIVALHTDRLEALLQRAEAALAEEDYELIKALAESYAYLTGLVEDKGTTIQRLRKLLFGSPTEKTRGVIPQKNEETAAASAETPTDLTEPADREEETVAERQGHGRNGADAYSGAEKIQVTHESLHSGDACPDCTKGKVYEMARPGVLIRMAGQAPVQGRVYELQRLRCHLWGKVFTARAPEGAGSAKYDATSASMIALLKYGSGLPFNRLEGLQGSVGLPLPASTQWDIVNATARRLQPASEELIRQAAQGEVVHNDDTTMKILAVMTERAKDETSAEGAPQRKGVFTSGIVSTNAGHRIALFFTGRKHAGENLATVLARRAADLGPPIQMCDALSRNLPAELQTMVANCLAHARRQFVDVAENFPDACRYVLERLGVVYRNDAAARAQNLSPEARLQLHQAESGPIMATLHTWLAQQFEDRLAEPNSGLGQAIAYSLRHWEKLTLFLRQPGAPLDNNVCERALKKAILHRKNALFYKTEHGARVGDLFMSLIHTCQLNDTDPFDYLTVLQRRAESLSSNPSKWMPWNYREALAPIATPTTSSP